MKKIVGLLSSLVEVSGLQHSLGLYTSGTVFMASIKLHQFILNSVTEYRLYTSFTVSRKAGYKISEISAYILLNSLCWTQKEQWIQATQASWLYPHKIIMVIISRLLFSLCYNTAHNLRAPPTAKSHFNLNPRLHHPLLNVPMSVMGFLESLVSSLLSWIQWPSILEHLPVAVYHYRSSREPL